MKARCAALGLVLALAAACDDEPSVDAGEAEAEPVTWQPAAGTELRYVSSWDWTGAEQRDGYWVFETDLGVRVGIDLGYLATATVMLVPCEGSLRSHTTVSDESLLLGPWIEDFGDGPTEQELGVGQTSGAEYCALHWLAAPVDEAAADGHLLSQTSIDVRGWFEGSDGRREFESTVGLSAGGLRLLSSEALPEAGQGAVVRLIRRPARALDGVELDGLSDSELAFEFIQGLARGSSVWVEAEA